MSVTGEVVSYREYVTSSPEDRKDEDGEDDEDGNDEDYNESTSDEDSQVPSDSEDPLTANSDTQTPAEAKPLAMRCSPRVVKPTPEPPGGVLHG